MMDQLEDLNKKMDELDEEGDSYDDEESDQDLDSELGDTLDVMDIKAGRANLNDDAEED